jgi:hypothetical protein
MAAVCLYSVARRRKQKRLLLLGGSLWVLMQRRIYRTTRSIWQKSWLSRREDLGAFDTLLSELKEEDKSSFLNFLRVTPGIFENLVLLITPHIERQNTTFRKSIPPAVRLAITLRFLATGKFFLHFLIHFLRPSYNVFDLHNYIHNFFLLNLILLSTKV